MSADNYVAILRCTDGYRVVHCQAIENLYYWPTGRISECKMLEYDPETGEDKEIDIPEMEERTEINPEILKGYFEGCKFFKSEKAAYKYAECMVEEIGYVEYGITILYYDKEFPK